MTNQFHVDYKELYDHAPCGYLCLSPSGVIMEANERFLAFTGYEKEEIISKLHFIDFLSKAQKIFFETNFRPILKTQGKIEEINLFIIRKDKSKFPALINSVEIKNEKGEHLYTQSTIFDISQRKSYEIELLAAKNKADKLTTDLKKKNKLLRGGLNYSKKIQYSILPSLSKVQSSFKNSFIYYQPKDEIGGDFYWFWKNENFAFFAVIDCTGHGVPGALMSMSINSMLNEILQKGETFDTGKILGLLHQKVYQTLQQEQGDEYSQDGCEIAICRLESSTKILTYAGANIDLLLYDNGTRKIIEATNKSIGGLPINGDLEPTRNFETITVPYHTDSMLIMATDGLVDQLNIKDVAYGINEFGSMAEKLYKGQSENGKKIVEASVKKWMKGTPQLDDMLLVGFFANL